MHKVLLSMAVLSAMVLAGCSGGSDDPKYEAVTCPDGTVLTPDQVKELVEAKEEQAHAAEGEHDHAAPGAELCPEEPSVTLTGIPAQLQAFKTAPFKWSLDNGSLPHAHSMITSIRYSDRSVPDADLTAVSKYPTELIKREHQDTPITYSGNLSFAKPGKVYLRAYAQIAGEDYWSPEIELTVMPVPPSGVLHDVTHGPGDFLSPPTPSALTITIGDAVRLVNEDVLPHECGFTSGPSAVNALASDSGAGEPVLFVVPGTYTFTCDEVQPQTITITAQLN